RTVRAIVQILAVARGTMLDERSLTFFSLIGCVTEGRRLLLRMDAVRDDSEENEPEQADQAADSLGQSWSRCHTCLVQSRRRVRRSNRAVQKPSTRFKQSVGVYLDDDFWGGPAAAFSLARAPLSVPLIASFPSWHAYS